MKVALVDLNNFSRYPTLSIGYFVAILRREGVEVEVCSPLNFGIHGYARTVRQSYWQRFSEFANYCMAVSTSGFINELRNRFKSWLRPGGGRDREVITQAVEDMLSKNFDVVMVSAYTMYRETCSDIAQLCVKRNIPVVLGGSGFYSYAMCEEWLEIPGVRALYSGEPEKNLLKLVSALATGEEISDIPGVVTRNNSFNPAQPLVELDSIPFPDFSDFPWENYPNRIVPVMTARGCEWGLCTFCSDVKTTSGRTYRSRTLDMVLSEIEKQQCHYSSDLFVFLDLKLNSNLALWRGLPEGIKKLPRPIRWTASVHVDSRDENGLSYTDLKRAAESGLVRITCGLESASRDVLRHMAKGVKLHRMSEFIKSAHKAGISVRITCMVGYPNETAEDVQETANFLRQHSQYIERVTLNRFANMPGTPIEEKLRKSRKDYPHILVKELDTLNGVFPYENRRMSRPSFLKAVYKLIAEVNSINRKPLLAKAFDFEGAF
ncbi:B12-binding domain-containing radical SAM protein [Microbulbifer sp. M83]|uniref:B12-binding domain-containing radical SAM protein n=1 Tax=Microbulbifer sp. M83 TaxID=3118246 RepID=UPI002FE152F2